MRRGCTDETPRAMAIGMALAVAIASIAQGGCGGTMEAEASPFDPAETGPEVASPEAEGHVTLKGGMDLELELEVGAPSSRIERATEAPETMDLHLSFESEGGAGAATLRIQGLPVDHPVTPVGVGENHLAKAVLTLTDVDASTGTRRLVAKNGMLLLYRSGAGLGGEARLEMAADGAPAVAVWASFENLSPPAR